MSNQGGMAYLGIHTYIDPPRRDPRGPNPCIRLKLETKTNRNTPDIHFDSLNTNFSYGSPLHCGSWPQ